VRRGRLAGERGATLVEFAIVLPVFLLILFAILEFGLGFNTQLTAYNTSRSAARVASAMGNEPEADFSVVRAAVKDGDVAIVADLRRIVVFRATSSESDVPPQCTTSQVGFDDVCNVYLPADFADPIDEYGCGGSELDQFWCPSNRKVALSGSQGPPDYIGVWVEFRHDMLTGLFGGQRTITDQTVMRIEPRRR
jgi:hypothetical protein